MTTATTDIVNVNFRAKKEDKLNAERVCKELGISMSAALNVFIKTIGREKRIPLDFSLDPFYEPSNQAYLKSQIDGVKNGTIKLEEHNLIMD
ncbi:type II toxin-antitoxin system RelB/DinJ family antitoxin [Gardnerella greenwoodii]|uniref:type II toxin-antitoxin system RelB/DinJ family antitoxin n=1 Tax=Gardnerella greenwoodii TaxID=2914925 RepID=UPI0039EFCE27